VKQGVVENGTHPLAPALKKRGGIFGEYEEIK